MDTIERSALAPQDVDEEKKIGTTKAEDSPSGTPGTIPLHSDSHSKYTC